MGNKITITGRRRPTIDERYTRPQGLYPHRDVDHRKLRKLIHDAKLAPCYPGAEEPAADLEECPICFLHYPSLNRSKCCTKGICTECFLQMKSPHVSRPTQCPFCKTPNYAVEYRGAKSLEEKGVEQAEEQKVIEAKIRMRQQELQDEEYRVYRRDDDSRHGRAASLPLSATTSTQTLNMSLGDSDCMTVLDAVPGGGREPRMRGSTARPVGTPQPGMFSTAGLFASPTVAVGPDSLWFRGGQRSEATDLAGGMRQPLLASSTSPSVRMPPANLMAGNGSTGSAVASVVGNIAGIRGGGSTYARLNRLQDSPASRDDEFDLDLEDIMVMEAIWLSIQEQGPQRHEHDTGSVAEETRMSFLSQMIARNQDFRVGENELPTGPAVLSVDSRGPSRRNSVTGGLAGAIAALAERQVVGGAGDGLSSQLDPPDEQFVPAADQSAGLEVELDRAVMESHSSSLAVLGTSNDTDDSHLCTSNDPRAFTRDSGAEIEPGVQTVNIQEQENTCSEFDSGSARVSQFRAAETHSMAESSEGCVEWGAQSARQLVMSDDNKGCAVISLDEVVDSGPEVALTVSTTLSLQESLQEAQDDANRAIGTGQVIMPETFEEQMMLAMALSLAEVQSMVACGDEQGDEQDISSRAHP